MASLLFVQRHYINLENLKIGLVRTKFNVSPGIDEEVKKGINEKKLNKLYNELKSQKYRPKKPKRVVIPKLDRCMRYLGIVFQNR